MAFSIVPMGPETAVLMGMLVSVALVSFLLFRPLISSSSSGVPKKKQ